MAKPSQCRTCKRTGLILSRKRKCLSCIKNAIIAVNKQLRAKKGKHYKKWKRNLLKSLK